MYFQWVLFNAMTLNWSVNYFKAGGIASAWFLILMLSVNSVHQKTMEKLLNPLVFSEHLFYLIILVLLILLANINNKNHVEKYRDPDLMICSDQKDTFIYQLCYFYWLNSSRNFLFLFINIV